MRDVIEDGGEQGRVREDMGVGVDDSEGEEKAANADLEDAMKETGA